MAKKKLIKFEVSSANWMMNISVDSEIFDDTYVEACTQAIENKLKNINSDDFLVNPVIFCKRVKPTPGEPKYINTYKILINAGMPKRAEHLRRIFQSSTDIDLATEPISASLKP